VVSLPPARPGRYPPPSPIPQPSRTTLRTYREDVRRWLASDSGQAVAPYIGVPGEPPAINYDRSNVAAPFYVMAQSFVRFIVKRASIEFALWSIVAARMLAYVVSKRRCAPAAMNLLAPPLPADVTLGGAILDRLLIWRQSSSVYNHVKDELIHIRPSSQRPSTETPSVWLSPRAAKR
jgi:hypothetical protein